MRRVAAIGVKEDTNVEGVEKLHTMKIETLFSSLELSFVCFTLLHNIISFLSVSFCKMAGEHKRMRICLVPVSFLPAVLHGLFAPCPAPPFGLFSSLDNEASGGKSTISAVRQVTESISDRLALLKVHLTSE